MKHTLGTVEKYYKITTEDVEKFIKSFYSGDDPESPFFGIKKFSVCYDDFYLPFFTLDIKSRPLEDYEIRTIEYVKNFKPTSMSRNEAALDVEIALQILVNEGIIYPGEYRIE